MGEIQDKEKIAELCGAVIGDGWIQSNERSFFIAGDPTEDKEYYDGYLKDLISELLTPVVPREFPYWQVYGISIHKKEIIQKLLSYDIPKGKKVKIARVPEWIKKSDKKIIRSFIRGLFDADGCIFCQKDYTKYANEFNSKYHTKMRLRISGISQTLIEEIYELCKLLDFRCSKRMIKRKVNVKRNNSDVHILEINEINGIHRWFKEIIPSNSKHTSKYLVWEKFGFCPPNTKVKQREEILKNKLDPYSLY